VVLKEDSRNIRFTAFNYRRILASFQMATPSS